MSTVLWIVQGLLAVVFLLAGAAKLTRERESLAPVLPGVDKLRPEIVHVVGALELLGAIGVVVPMLTGIYPPLTAWAAVGLMFVMAGAAITHLKQKEYSYVIANFVLFALAAFVAWGRWPL